MTIGGIAAIVSQTPAGAWSPGSRSDAAAGAKKAKPDEHSSLWGAIFSQLKIGTAHAQAARANRTDENVGDACRSL